MKSPRHSSPAASCSSSASGEHATAGPDHPHREAACADITATDGDLDALPGQDTALCSNDAVEVTATAHGSVKGREVHWERTYESDCHLTLATGPVFDF
ncbi:SSI family serine proteinase inhibitor [Streptomyces filamentosus]|uniref:SSI family serine proteinase inhibitor n=1 Tax=Streptomyces filamentosus TaxID=67294 RepID=UPI0033C9EAA7